MSKCSYYWKNKNVGNNLFWEENFVYIISVINIYTKAIFNSDKIVTRNNLYKKNSKINIKELFKQV